LNQNINSILLIILMMTSLILIGCANDLSVDESVGGMTAAQQYVGATQTQENLSPILDATATSEAVETAQATRPKPEQWMLWPVVPEVTTTAREIYQKGLTMGNNPRAFSKVGDCQNVHNAFLGFFDQPGRYDPEGRVKPFLDTIENFKGYFDRDGEATKFGFNAAAVLSPLWANPDVCLPDENPLECELRITKPTFVLISLEFWFKGRTPETYERYMRQIIEYTISQGAVPILATKADNVEKDHSLNLTTAQLAYEYDLPVWNFWLACQSLADKGIDPDRDGFHISVQAWNERSFTFLEVLDHLWKELHTMG
jgi:hypothetical protein